MTSFAQRRLVLAAAAAAPFAVAGCAAPGTTASAGGTVLAEAPVYRVGDRWTYRIASGFRAVADYEEVVEVIAVGADGIEVRVSERNTPAPATRIERWRAPGLVLQGTLTGSETRRFAEPLERFRFPLASGQRWNQWVEQVNETGGTSGRINRFVDVRGLASVTVPAGTFEAVRMSVLMTLDDETPFRFATQATYATYYAAAVRNVVREERRAQYRERGSGRDGQPMVPAQNEVATLLAFTPGR